jgi:hypothetical protein
MEVELSLRGHTLRGHTLQGHTIIVYENCIENG